MSVNRVEYLDHVEWTDQDGRLHREDGPAFVGRHGSEKWYLHGRLHREDGPAIKNGKHIEWWLNGKRHRIDGPAYEDSDGNKEWYVDGKLHRIDGPAIERSNGNRCWYVNGKRHRLDGPAMLIPHNGHWINGNPPADTLFWYINGNKVTEKQFNETVNSERFKRGDSVFLEKTGMDFTLW